MARVANLLRPLWVSSPVTADVKLLSRYSSPASPASSRILGGGRYLPRVPKFGTGRQELQRIPSVSYPSSGTFNLLDSIGCCPKLAIPVPYDFNGL